MRSSRSTCRPRSTAASATSGLSWHDIDRSLLAINRGHVHANRKLARDATIEFALALDGKGDVECEPTGPNEAILFRADRAARRRQRDGRHAGQRRVHRMERRSRDVRALAPAGPQLVSFDRSRRRSSTPPPRNGTISSSRFPTSTFPSRPTPCI